MVAASEMPGGYPVKAIRVYLADPELQPMCELDNPEKESKLFMGKYIAQNPNN